MSATSDMVHEIEWARLDPDDLGHIGATIRAAREGAGVTPRDLARQAGIPLARLRQIESGERVPNLNDRWHIATALGALLGR